jgi:uncharacterized cupredoxin-like copper-binding protein
MPGFRIAAVALIGAGVIGCKSDSSTSRADASRPSAEPPKAVSRTVTVAARDFAFDAPGKIPAGGTRFELVNHGKELHQAQLIKLEDGKTLQDLAKAMKTPGPIPGWVKFVGGPNGIAPGQQANATAVLTPGQYAYICFIPSSDGVVHLAKGMARPFEVTADSTGAATELPTPDITIKLSDYDFQPSQPLTPGRHTIRVENVGPQRHEIVLLRLAPGKKVEDFGKWAETGMKGAPPAEPIGGVVLLDKGGQGSFDVDLTPGEYGFICFVPDSKDGKPHLTHGMMKQVKVG